MTDDEVIDALLRLDDVWRTAREAGLPANTLRALRERGLVDYRPPNGAAGVLRVGEWARTDAGDRLVAQ